WSQASQLCRDVEWADALLAETFERSEATSLFQVLPQTRQEDFIIELLRRSPSLRTDKPARNYIASCWRPWGVKLSRAVIDSLLHHAATDRFKEGWMWLGFLNTIGCRIAPALIPEAVTQLTEAAKPWVERAYALEQFLDFIQFRHEMLKEANQ